MKKRIIMKYVAVFDVGGTDVKYGLFNPADSTLVFKQSFPTCAGKGGPFIYQNIIDKTNELKQTYDLLGVGISSAGVIDSTTGVVLNATKTIPNFIGLKISETVGQATGLKVTVENDVNCFALAEIANRPKIKDFVLITLGTGIGGAIVVNRRIYRGASFASGEVGRMYVGDVTWEETSSVKALVSLAQAQELPVNNGIELFRLYDEGNKEAIELINHWYFRVAKGISNLIYLFNPEILAIGGAISNRPTLIQELMPFLKKTCDATYLKNTKIVTATLQSDGGLYGAYYHFCANYMKA
jgi:predicted NBD/HSP70 family sugar kinase